MPRGAGREAHAELERQVRPNLPRILGEPLEIPLLAATERPCVALGVGRVIPEQRVRVRVIRVEGILRRGRVVRREIEAAGEAGRAETLAVDVVLVVDPRFHEMPPGVHVTLFWRLQRRSMASMGNRASQATFGAAVPRRHTGERQLRIQVELVERRRVIQRAQCREAVGSALQFEIGSGIVSTGATSGVFRYPNDVSLTSWLVIVLV